MKFQYKIAQTIRKFVLSYPPKIDITDDYIKRLCLINAGLLHEGNLYCFNYAIRHLRSAKPIVEIGAFCGLSTNILSYYLRKAKKKNLIFTCDPWHYEFNKGSLGNKILISDANFGRFAKESFVRSTKMFSKRKLPYGFQLSSDKFFKLWGKKRHVKDVFGRDTAFGGQISFCYIDGDHSYQQTKKDFENIDLFLEDGGFIFFDDSAPYSGFECTRLMGEIQRNKKYKLIIKNPNFLFQKI